MVRPLLTLLLLLNYLLVVGVGMLVSQPLPPRFSAAHPYVHSADCQRHHYLRLDCFERCNGDQPTARSRPLGSSQHLLALLKRLDEHCQGTAIATLPPAPTGHRLAAGYPLPGPVGLPLGFAGRGLRPPQRA